MSESKNSEIERTTLQRLMDYLRVVEPRRLRRSDLLKILDGDQSPYNESIRRQMPCTTCLHAAAFHETLYGRPQACSAVINRTKRRVKGKNGTRYIAKVEKCDCLDFVAPQSARTELAAIHAIENRAIEKTRKPK